MMEQSRPDPAGMPGKTAVLAGLAILIVVVGLPAIAVAIVVGRIASSWGERPALARDLAETSPAALSSAFRDRVTLRFPIGTTETELLGELRAEGFVIKAPRHALFKRPDFPCRNEWRIAWEASGGLVTAVSGSTLDPPRCL